MEQPTEQNQSAEIAPSGTILVIDNTPTNLKVIAGFFKDLNYKVLVARNGNSGIARAEHGQPDLILLDVMMPGMNGFECCRLLKESPTTKDIPIIFMTALTDKWNKIRGFEAGAVDYITKPIEQDELLVRVKNHITLRQLTADLEREVENRYQELRQALEREKHLAQELSQALDAEKEVTRFRSHLVEVITHEFYTPLTAIEQANFLLKNHYAELDVVKRDETHGRITTGANYIKKILQDVALVYRNEDEIGVTFKEVSIDTIGSAIHTYLESNLDSLDRIEIVESARSGAVETDIDLLTELLFHLVSNGLKFSEAPAVVQIQLSVQDNHLDITVRDHGVGIPEVDQGRIFDLFDRASNVDARRGLGIGLHIAKSYTKILGGDLSFYSAGADQGSLFTVRVPLIKSG